jgi:hypothetical protein
LEVSWTAFTVTGAPEAYASPRLRPDTFGECGRYAVDFLLPNWNEPGAAEVEFGRGKEPNTQSLHPRRAPIGERDCMEFALNPFIELRLDEVVPERAVCLEASEEASRDDRYDDVVDKGAPDSLSREERWAKLDQRVHHRSQLSGFLWISGQVKLARFRSREGLRGCLDRAP